MCKLRFSILLLGIFGPLLSFSQYAPPAGQVGTTAIHKDSMDIVNWAQGVYDFVPGPVNISNGPTPVASYGDATSALGYAEGDGTNVVSLGDGGMITLFFQLPIQNGSGPDFAVFENGFSDDFLELAFVEVSTDGIKFVRFPAHSVTQTSTQVGSFGSLDATEINNFAGKYRQGYGTPFDLEELTDSTGIDLNNIQYIRIIDVVGSIDHAYASFDSYGNAVNDPFPTGFESGGFDLDGIAVIHENFDFAGIAEKEIIQIYPNPSQGQIWVKGVTGEVTIYNSAGQLILSKYIDGNEQIDLSEFGSGLYFINIGDYNQKLLIH